MASKAAATAHAVKAKRVDSTKRAEHSSKSKGGSPSVERRVLSFGAKPKAAGVMSFGKPK